MDPSACVSAVEGLLKSSVRLLSARYFRVTVSEEPPATDAQPGAADPRPALHVVCRHSKSERGTQSVDKLGASGEFAGRGYFEAPRQHGPTSLTVVTDRVHSKSELEELLAHELQHAVDYVVHGLDMASCGGLACAEVRAAAQAECAGIRPAFLRRKCMRDKAWISTDMVFPGIGGQCVQLVFDACKDTSPDENPGGPGSPLHALLVAEAARLAAASATPPTAAPAPPAQGLR